MRKLSALLSGVALTALLAGCATTEGELHTREALRSANTLRQVSEQPAAPANVSPVQVKPAAYVGSDVTRNLHGDALPSKFQRDSITVQRAGASSLQDVANALTSATGIPVAVATTNGSQNATATATAPANGADMTAGGLAAGPIPEGFPLNDALNAINGNGAPAPVAAAAVGGGSLGVSGTMRLNYSGKLSGLLDLIAANFNISWEYKNNRILFSTTQTRVFDVPALPIISQLSFSMSSGAESSGAGATSSGRQSAETQASFDLWSQLQETVGGIVGSSGTFQMSGQTGQIVVQAPPSTIDRVAAYVKQLNAQLNKQVAISVKVYSVAVNDNDSYSSDLSSILGGLNLNYSNTGNTGGAGGGSLGWAVLNGGNSANGSLRALSQRSDVSTVTSASVTALNGVPVPVQVANTRGYAQQVSVTVDANGNPSSSITPGSVTTGFNLHLVPKILNDGNLLLQYGMNISELAGAQNGFDVFSSNGSSIQLPNITQRNFIQQARIPNGSTLVLAGFEQVRASTDKDGPVHPGLWPLGGNRQGGMKREVLVIAITPVVLDISPSAQATYSQ